MKNKLKKIIIGIIRKASPTYQLMLAQDRKIDKIKDELNAIHQKLAYLYIKQGGGASLLSGERQVFESIEDFRSDHRERYEFAAEVIVEDSQILDIACGVGYGSQILSQVKGVHVTGVDISEDAIQFAIQNFFANNASYVCSCVEAYNSDHQFDFITSFETIEHIEDDYGFIKKIYSLMKEGGAFLCSVPNEDRLPYNPSRFPFHFKHYKKNDLDSLLRNAGFSEINYFNQALDISGINSGYDGTFIIALAKR